MDGKINPKDIIDLICNLQWGFKHNKGVKGRDYLKCLFLFVADLS